MSSLLRSSPSESGTILRLPVAFATENFVSPWAEGVVAMLVLGVVVEIESVGVAEKSGGVGALESVLSMSADLLNLRPTPTAFAGVGVRTLDALSDWLLAMTGSLVNDARPWGLLLCAAARALARVVRGAMATDV
jgi:hypothetical protein